MAQNLANSPMAAMNRNKIFQIVDALDETELANLNKLLQSPKARGYLSSNIKFLMLKSFI